MKAEGNSLGPPRNLTRRRRLRRALCLIAVGLCLIWFLTWWVVVPYRIMGSSMLPTFIPPGDGGQAGDVVLVNRLTYQLGSPGRWDVVVFRRSDGNEDGGADSVKRVVGLPGETVEIKEGVLWVQGVPLSYPVPGSHIVSKGPYGRAPVRLSGDEYFLLGDNSYLSRDSRSWGPVRRQDILGRVFLILFPARRFRWVR